VKRLIILFLMVICMIIPRITYADYYVDAESYVLIEKESLRVLDGKNIDKQLLTASICKIMTCIVAIEKSDLEKEFIVTKDVISQVGSSIYLKEGEKIKLIDLLYGLMLRSGNDAAYMIAKSISGDVEKFVMLMNDKAKKIGMKHSYFSNPSGLDDINYNYSTAYDMAILMAYCLNNEVFSKITNSKEYSYVNCFGERKTFLNKHKLVRAYDFVTGGKTGVGL